MSNSEASATPMGIPPELEARFGGWDKAIAWAHVPEATTWRLTRAGATRFLKLLLPDQYPTLADERDRTQWLAGYLNVPSIVGYGATPAGEWLLTEAVAGEDATKARNTMAFEALVQSLARGLRTFHALPIAECPFDFRLSVALEHVRERVNAGKVMPERHFHEIHQHHTPASALAALEAERPAAEDLVVCHGDYCLPNMMLENGEVTGYIDLGEVGVADRWWDLAVATWSLDWNLGPGWTRPFLEAYGIEEDEKRMAYYRLLYEMVG